jgi:hypothetical protein
MFFILSEDFFKTFKIYLTSLSENISSKIFHSGFKKFVRKDFSKTFLFYFLKKTFLVSHFVQILYSKYFSSFLS